ncbi:hypothetical protein AQUCO_01400783v1 [Aquilegia coerulea]|uniref:Uncharacterized protein n=1 Tax=Aquilegia coerulea TaxID=218851 RepID=A0A2G5DY20_AQUCA|nr:hypothetical protein AQUCO_01400783v1 [Aquilegia coerulea]PIA48411.1 hypothetical protein AQUCO_01400783v1 [Aquilegia coerulea]
MFSSRLQVVKEVFRKNLITKMFTEAQLFAHYCCERMQLNHSKKNIVRRVNGFEKSLRENRDKIPAEDAESVEKAITSFRRVLDETDTKFSAAIGSMRREVLDDKKMDALLRHAKDTYSKVQYHL